MDDGRCRCKKYKKWMIIMIDVKNIKKKITIIVDIKKTKNEWW
jgi:hypothetical protein